MGIFIGGLLAGLFMILRELFPWMKARQTGQIRKRGHGRQLVLRAEEPERFKRLLRNHTDGMTVGLMAIGLGVVSLVLGWLALFLLIPIGSFMAWQARPDRQRLAADAPAQPYDGRL